MKIFISYRREDSIHQSGRIHEWLCRHFAKDDIFFDVDSIPPGANWKSYLDDMIGQCDVLLVPIGDQWLLIMQERADQTDMVRYEIEAALRRGIPIIPLQVGRAPMPDESTLPESIRDLTAYQGVPVRPGPDFRTDMSGLIESMEREFGDTPTSPGHEHNQAVSATSPSPPVPNMRPEKPAGEVTKEDSARPLSRTLTTSLLWTVGYLLIVLLLVNLSMPSHEANTIGAVSGLLILVIAILFLRESKIVLPFSDCNEFERRLQQLTENDGYTFKFQIYRFPLVSDENGRRLYKNTWGRILVVTGENSATIIGHTAAIQAFSKRLSEAS